MPFHVTNSYHYGVINICSLLSNDSHEEKQFVQNYSKSAAPVSQDWAL